MNEFQSQSYVPNGSSLPTPQPVFSLATPGQQFGFRLPNLQASQTADTNQSTGQMTTEVNVQVPSCTQFYGVASRSSSSSASISSRSTFFSAGSSRLQGTSTAPTSSASFVCYTSERIHPQALRQQGDTASTSSSCAIRTILPQLPRYDEFNEQQVNSQLPVRTAGLQCTASFYHAPLSLNETGHSITAVPRIHNDGGAIEVCFLFYGSRFTR